MNDLSPQRLAKRIHDLLLHELGESVDVHLMLGPPEYALAVLSLCRSSGNPELARAGEAFRKTMQVAPSNRGTPLQEARKGLAPPVGGAMTVPKPLPTGFSPLI